MKSFRRYIREDAKQVVMAAYVDRLRDEFKDNPNDVDTYQDITERLFSYLKGMTDAQLKSLCTQVGLGTSGDKDQLRSRILHYVLDD